MRGFAYTCMLVCHAQVVKCKNTTKDFVVLNACAFLCMEWKIVDGVNTFVDLSAINIVTLY